jgi:hypothetical protein
MKKIFVLALISFISIINIYAQSHNSSQGHEEQVNCIGTVSGLNYDQSFFTAGQDGFIIKWSSDNQGEHYQITDVGIKFISISPNGNDIAVYETDGGSVNKVSVWDWKTLNRKFQKKFTDSITSLKFSAKGNYLIIGTATVDGAVFVRTNTWNVIDKIKSNTSIVNYINTSDSEKTCVLYSPTGNLSYYDMASGSLKQKFSIMPGLNQCLMFNNNNYFAGIKDNNIYVINAYKGSTVSSIQAQNPIILSSDGDSNLYYLEYDGKALYQIKMLENLETKDEESGKVTRSVSNPRLVKTLHGPRGSGAINCGYKKYNDIFLGSKSGSIYRLDAEATSTTYNMEEITSSKYSKVYDICAAPEDFYFLSKNKIYRSSFDSGEIKELAKTSGQTNIISKDDNTILLWTKGSKSPVTQIDLSTNSTKELFNPVNTIQNLRHFNINGKDYLVEIESNTTVNIFDFSNNSYREIYSGSGIQDAILANDGKLYVSKSAATNPQVPMLCVNLETLETVPLSVKGNVIYGLSTNGTLIYGINLISDESGRATYVFSYNTQTKVTTNILKFSDEDSDAFTYLYGNNLFTNIGKNKVYCYNLNTKKRFAYNRSASMPQTICQQGGRLVILNYNGSISWCNPTSQLLLADWYLTTDEQWYEF